MNDSDRFLTLTPEEWQAVALSLKVAISSVLFSLPPAVLVGWLLGRSRFFGRSVVDAFVHLPFVLPPVVTGYLLLLVFGVRGPVGALLNEWFGIRLAFTTSGAILATAVMTFPLMVSKPLSLQPASPRAITAHAITTWIDRKHSATIVVSPS